MIEFQILQSAYTKISHEELTNMLINNGFECGAQIKIDLQSIIVFPVHSRPTLEIYVRFTQEQNL